MTIRDGESLDSQVCNLTTVYAGPKGVGSARGTSLDPLSLAKAVAIAAPGSIIVLLEGDYVLDDTLVVSATANGTPLNPIVMESQTPGRAVIDGSRLPESSPLFVLEASNWCLRGIVFRSSKAEGLIVEGSCNRVEGCESHSNTGAGICLRGVPQGMWPHSAESNHFIDCRSHGNGTPETVPAAGFQVSGAICPGNVFFRCTAFENAGTGFDVALDARVRQRLAVEFDRCVSCDNGKEGVASPDCKEAGRGCGFRLRIAGAQPQPDVEAWHCVAAGNAFGGFVFDRAVEGALRFCSSQGNGRSGQDYLCESEHVQAFEQVKCPHTCDCRIADEVVPYLPNGAGALRESAGAGPQPRKKVRAGAKARCRKDILVLISSRGRGGAERVACRIATALSEWHDVRLLSFVRRKSVYPVGEKVGLIDASFDKYEGGNPLFAAFESVRKWVNGVTWLMRAKKGYAALTSMSLLLAPNVLNAAFGASWKVMSERNDPSLMPGRYFSRARSCYRRADWVVFQSRAVQAMFDEDIRRKSCVIANPVEVDRCALPTRQKKIVTAGRFVPQKNHGLLLRAFALFRAHHPDYSLHLYGEGGLQESLEELACDLGLESCVHFEGFRDDIHDAMADAQMFVLPSSYEGMPNAFIEAMLMGIACITTDYAVTGELVTDGWDALVVSAGDAQALAHAMCALAEDDALRTSIEAHAMARAADFDTCNVARQWERIL